MRAYETKLSLSPTAAIKDHEKLSSRCSRNFFGGLLFQLESFSSQIKVVRSTFGCQAWGPNVTS